MRFGKTIPLQFTSRHVRRAHRDELATLDDAWHLDWGYVDHAPLIGLVARLAEGTGGEPVKSLAPLVPEVRAFWNLVTSEATGWQATLRDKNVPLP